MRAASSELVLRTLAKSAGTRMRTNSLLRDFEGGRLSASARRTRGERKRHSATSRSVGKRPCSGLVVTPYILGMKRRTMAPRRKLKWDLQRIEGPFNQIDAPPKGLLTLEELQLAPSAPIAVRPQNRGHMGVQKGLSAAHARNRQGKADHAIAGECAHHLPAGLGGDDEERKGNDINIGRSPDRALDLDAGGEFREAGAAADRNLQRFFFGRFAALRNRCHGVSAFSAPGQNLRPLS